MTPTGSFTEFTTPTANSSPDTIVTGPDRNLWFTESAYAASRVASINP
jgi:virginiamycin B lyase